MPYILSISELKLPHLITQEKAMEFAREMFSSSFKDINRLLKAFVNGQIETRYFSNDMEWFKKDHTFEEKNDTYITQAVQYGAEAVTRCLSNPDFLSRKINESEIEAIFFISSTGIATPSIDARIMNILPFSAHTKRIPIWGLGCAGGAAGLSRAFDYCKAYPKAKVLVLSVELCSLTFQKDDLSKGNLIGTSIFADGVACALICGDEVEKQELSKLLFLPNIEAVHSTLLENSLDVMGWEVKNNGLFVIFSKDIPALVKNWLKPNVEEFLKKHGLTLHSLTYFIAHPGGKKVVEAYEEALGFSQDKTSISLQVLKEFGNMSSATILYVLRRYMTMKRRKNEIGLAAALGPGFSSELLILRWK